MTIRVKDLPNGDSTATTSARLPYEDPNDESNKTKKLSVSKIGELLGVGTGEGPLLSTFGNAPILVLTDGVYVPVSGSSLEPIDAVAEVGQVVATATTIRNISVFVEANALVDSDFVIQLLIDGSPGNSFLTVPVTGNPAGFIQGIGSDVVPAGSTIAWRLKYANNLESGEIKLQGIACTFDIAGEISPLNVKGDLYGFTTKNARVPVGRNYQTLVANRAFDDGLAYQDHQNNVTPWLGYAAEGKIQYDGAKVFYSIAIVFQKAQPPATKSLTQIASPISAYYSNFTIIVTSQETPFDNDVVIATLQVDGEDTNIVITIPQSGSSVGTFETADPLEKIWINAGQLLNWKFDYGANDQGEILAKPSFIISGGGNVSAFISHGAVSGISGLNQYHNLAFTPNFGSNILTDEQIPIPVAGLYSDFTLNIYQVTATPTQPIIARLNVNGSITDVFITIPAGVAVDTILKSNKSIFLKTDDLVVWDLDFNSGDPPNIQFFVGFSSDDALGVHAFFDSSSGTNKLITFDSDEFMALTFSGKEITRTDMVTVVPLDQTYEAFHVVANKFNDQFDKEVTFTLQVNDSDTDVVITIPANTGAAGDIFESVGSVDVEKGDKINWRFDANGSIIGEVGLALAFGVRGGSPINSTILTEKGDILGFSINEARLTIGTEGQFLTVKSTNPLGYEWTTPAAPIGGTKTWAVTDEDSGIGEVGLVYTTEPAEITKTLTDVILSLKTAADGTAIEVDILQEDAVNSNDFDTIFSTKPKIDLNQFTSQTSGVTPVFSETTWTLGRRLQIVITIADSNATASGLKVTLV